MMLQVPHLSNDNVGNGDMTSLYHSPKNISQPVLGVDICTVDLDDEEG